MITWFGRRSVEILFIFSGVMVNETSFSKTWSKIIQESILEWLGTNQKLAWVMVPCFAFLEACPGMGLFVSSILLLSICTLLYSQELVGLSLMLPLAFSGACMSDHLGFYTGRWLGPKFHGTQFAKRRAETINKAEAILLKYGVFSILFGRLIPAVRSKVPLLVGVSGFSRLTFTVVDLIACLIWTVGLGVLVVGLENFFG